MAGNTGLQQYWIAAAHDKTANFRRIDLTVAPLSVGLNALGILGMTAYFGLPDMDKLRTGQTVVVSGAADAVGQSVGKIAKRKRCRIVSVAGGPEKCRSNVESPVSITGIDCKA